MASTLRPFRGARSLRGRPLRNVETLAELHAELVRERQDLRAGDAELAALEQNRLAIVHCQWELSRALIERYLARGSAIPAA
jgi:hypothetical protein